MNDDPTPEGATPALDELASLVKWLSAPRPLDRSDASIFKLYPRGCDVEVLGAIRFLMEVEGVPAAKIEARADFDPGAVYAILNGRERLSADAVRHLCRCLGMSRWLFYLVGSVQYGADLGLPELQWLIEERRRLKVENPDESLVELVAEATRLFFKLGGQSM